jgi:hypothetical protein
MLTTLHMPSLLWEEKIVKYNARMEDENVHVEHIEEKSMQERWQEVMNC